MAWSISAWPRASVVDCPASRQYGPEAVRRPVLGAEQQQGRGIGEDQCIAQLERAQRRGLAAVKAQHPAADSPDLQREREDRRGPGPAGGLGEDRPAAIDVRVAQIRSQYRRSSCVHVRHRAFAQGQLELGQPLADPVGRVNEVPRLRSLPRAQPPTGCRHGGHGRHARVGGRHRPAVAGRLLSDQAPDPGRPSNCHPRRQWSRVRSGPAGPRCGTTGGARPPGEVIGPSGGSFLIFHAPALPA